mmetsp:Transcript_64352/g.104099  ORF Transcript_64352/g.104099 Transcript_64352/m.104099 type:complete len:117 (-) Transcript_64352:778-1128(-)
MYCKDGADPMAGTIWELLVAIVGIIPCIAPGMVIGCGRDGDLRGEVTGFQFCGNVTDPVRPAQDIKEACDAEIEPAIVWTAAGPCFWLIEGVGEVRPSSSPHTWDWSLLCVVLDIL